MRRTNKYHLNNTEKDIMNYFWNNMTETEATANDVKEYFNHHGKTWSNRATLVFLRDLTKKGMLKTGKKYGLLAYTPLMTEEEYELMPVKRLLHERYLGSFSDLFCSLCKTEEKYSEDDMERIREKLKDLDDL